MSDKETYQLERLNIVLSPKHRQALELIATDDIDSMSAVVRGLIVKEARARGLWPPPEGSPKG